MRAEENAETEQEKDTVQYYVNAVERLELPNIREQWEKFEGSEKGRILWEQTSLRIQANMLELAETKGHPLAQITYARDLLYNLVGGRLGYKTKAEQKQIFELCLQNLEQAASKGVSSAYFYLGMLYLGDEYVHRDIEKALDCYVRGAAKNNAYCFFELSRIYDEG